MKKLETKKINYYKTYNEDFVTSKNQKYTLPDDYVWASNNIFYQIGSKIIYGLAKIFSLIYCRWILQIKIVNTEILKKYQKQGYFLYGNHTQPFGDVWFPAEVCHSKRIYTIVSPSNLGVTGIGPFLPILGALPIPDSISKRKKFLDAVEQRIREKKCVVIYPEAHVWPYYTKIRPFDRTSFQFPVTCKVPAFCMTTTYYKRKFRKKPGIRIYVDGPFLPDETLSKKEAMQKLRDEIYETMVERSKNNEVEYIRYEEENGV